MSLNVIQIYRGPRLIADGYTATVNDLPLGSVESIFDIYSLFLDDGPGVNAMGVPEQKVTIKIHRQHGKVTNAVKHSLLAPQVSAECAQFAIWFNDGTNVHKFTSVGAIWNRVSLDGCKGSGSDLQYEITGPPIVHTVDDSPASIPFEEAIA